MSKITTSENKTKLDLIRRSATTSGIGLLLMAIIAPIAHFGILKPMIVRDDAAVTLQNIVADPVLFLLGTILLIVVAMLDVAVAFSLKRFFVGVNLEVVNYMSWLRVVYAGVFVGAIAFLLIPAIELLVGLQIGGGDLMRSVDAYYVTWDAALLLFAGHLLLLGWLFYKVDYTPSIITPFLVVAGLGYLIDSVGRLFINGYAIEVATVAFVGEVFLLLWLLVKGRTVTV